MMNLFGSSWDDLTLEAVETFLAGAEEEPLLWEAKGTALEAYAVRKAVCAFANSHEGGYLILGASREGRVWSLDGLQFPDEAAVWVDKVVGDGIRPRPEIDVKAFPVARNRHVAVVLVTPITVPPCINRGTVYERVPGRSIVKSPEVV
ncbi:MAG: putative DNA binding domain-containing protein [Thermoleophilia bacterium]|nr:putative DNA binding domain-containing protein [Thermoleophilia bacterium]